VKGWALVLLACLGIAAGLSMRSCDRPQPPAPSPRVVELRDSVQAHRRADSAALVEYGRNIERMRGDSLTALLAARATVWRTRVLPGRVDTLIARDTVRDSVLVAGADVRACLLADSALVVRGDSLAGELVQVRYDLQTCEKRPTSCSGWSAFGWGVAAGLGACLATSIAL
jgi:hypothetical protein